MPGPLVTFITVVYNGASELEPTIQSILGQSEKNFEYYIIDGGSTDGTIDLIRKYESRITGWITEKDKGLYDAMNKGMKMGTGQFLWFMNAGDRIVSSTVLSEIFTDLKTMPDVIYGETEIIDESGKSLGLRRLKAPHSLTWKSLQWGMVVCHQSFLVRREKCLPYDLQYRLAADIDWMIRVLKNCSVIHNTFLILSQFKTGGLSNQHIKPGLKERYAIMKKYYGSVRTFFNHLVLGTKLFFFYLLHRRI